MRYTLFDLDDNILGVVNAPSYDAAVASPAALALSESARGGHVLARIGTYSADPAATAAADALIDEAHARLAEALGRLGLSDVAVGHAIAGRGETALERARRDRLAEAGLGLGSGQALREPPPQTGVNINGRQMGRGMVAGEPVRRHAAPRRATPSPGDSPSRGQWAPDVDERGAGAGWDTVTPQLRRAARAEDASTAAALVGAGYDPTDVARALGIPIQAKASTPAPQLPRRVPVAPEPARPERVATTESVRTWGDSEAVTLTETERLEAALGTAFGLSEAERRHAGEGRR